MEKLILYSSLIYQGRLHHRLKKKQRVLFACAREVKEEVRKIQGLNPPDELLIYAKESITCVNASQSCVIADVPIRYPITFIQGLAFKGNENIKINEVIIIKIVKIFLFIITPYFYLTLIFIYHIMLKIIK